MPIITHYTTLQVLVNHILEDNSFKLNSLSETNDPHEYIKRTPSVGGTGNYDERYPIAMDHIQNVYPNKIKVGCFVVDEGVEENYHTWASILNAPLWAHYGGNNEGVAVVFNSEFFLDACRKRIDYPWALHADKVEYPESLEYIDEPYTIRLDEIVNLDYSTVAKYLFEKGKLFWFRKDHQWAYENEYRVMLFNEEIGSTMIDIKDSVKAIVFGEKVSSIVQNTIGEYCHKQRIKVLTIHYDELRNCYCAKNIYPE